VFNLVEAIVLIQGKFISTFVSYAVIIINVGGSYIALILFLFNAEFWEAPSHWIEYAVQCFVTATSFAFIFGNRDKSNVLFKYWYYEYGILSVALIISILKLFVYGDVIETEMGGERAAHFFEYTGELINDIFAFAFTVVWIQAAS